MIDVGSSEENVDTRTMITRSYRPEGSYFSVGSRYDAKSDFTSEHCNRFNLLLQLNRLNNYGNIFQKFMRDIHRMNPLTILGVRKIYNSMHEIKTCIFTYLRGIIQSIQF
jgi:hypothetical protein